ncbi:MAG: hypothetical protein IJY47_07605, partial [Clostridia bacterium]|nr:hypothetical protein [Clostridia bacterium]
KAFSRRSPLKIPLRPRRFMRRGGFAMKKVSPEGSYEHLRVVGFWGFLPFDGRNFSVILCFW